jgi:hypothetical protein
MGFIKNVVLILLVVGSMHLLSVFEPNFSPVDHLFYDLDPDFDAMQPHSIPESCELLSTDYVGAEDFCFNEGFAYTGLGALLVSFVFFFILLFFSQRRCCAISSGSAEASEKNSVGTLRAFRTE